MSTGTVEKSLRSIILSKKKVFEIQRVLSTRKALKNNLRLNLNRKSQIKKQGERHFEILIQKLNFVESCLSKENYFTIISLLKDDRFEELSLQQIYDELYQGFSRKIQTIRHHNFSRVTQTG